MLSQLFDTSLSLGVAQALIAAFLAIGVVLVARSNGVWLLGESLLAMGRGIVQVTVVGLVLVAVFSGPLSMGVAVLMLMLIAASFIAARQAPALSGRFWVAFFSIYLGAGSVIVTMAAVGVIEPALRSLIPVGSMIIANAMNTTALALDRFNGELRAHVGEVETALSLGADEKAAVLPYLVTSLKAAMIPRVNALSSLGIVWIPGLMAGMILAGADPVYAAIYQFAVLTMIYAASGLSALSALLLMRRRVFNPALQLVLPGRTSNKGL